MKDPLRKTIPAIAAALLTSSPVPCSAKFGDGALDETNKPRINTNLPGIVQSEPAERFSTKWAKEYFNASLSSVDANNIRGTCGAGLGAYTWRWVGIGSNLNGESTVHGINPPRKLRI